MSDKNPPWPVLSPSLQIAFYYRLQGLKQTYFAESLRSVVGQLTRRDLSVLNHELEAHVPSEALKKVASFGLRGELFFPVPLVLRKDPFLLGYYRLLYGLSQKEFYSKGPFGRFKRLEERGEVPDDREQELPGFCRSLARSGAQLVLGLDNLSSEIIRELQVLTVGPQLRGSENTRIGDVATRKVFDLIKRLVAPTTREATERSLVIENASHRTVLIEFASDPDILITEKLQSGTRHIVSIEIKGGSDTSNVHNRLGEAEKSHLKAKKLGCYELWTLIRVELPLDVAQRGSPTTTQFFNLDRILNARTKDHREFCEALVSRLGIRNDRRVAGATDYSR